MLGRSLHQHVAVRPGLRATWPSNRNVPGRRYAAGRRPRAFRLPATRPRYRPCGRGSRKEQAFGRERVLHGAIGGCAATSISSRRAARRAASRLEATRRRPLIAVKVDPVLDEHRVVMHTARRRSRPECRPRSAPRSTPARPYGVESTTARAARQRPARRRPRYAAASDRGYRRRIWRARSRAWRRNRGAPSGARPAGRSSSARGSSGADIAHLPQAGDARPRDGALGKLGQHAAQQRARRARADISRSPACRRSAEILRERVSERPTTTAYRVSSRSNAISAARARFGISAMPPWAMRGRATRVPSRRSLKAPITAEMS